MLLITNFIRQKTPVLITLFNGARLDNVTITCEEPESISIVDRNKRKAIIYKRYIAYIIECVPSAGDVRLNFGDGDGAGGWANLPESEL